MSAQLSRCLMLTAGRPLPALLRPWCAINGGSTRSFGIRYRSELVIQMHSFDLHRNLLLSWILQHARARFGSAQVVTSGRFGPGERSLLWHASCFGSHYLIS